MHEWVFTGDYDLITPDPYLKQRHRLSVGAGAGLLLGVEAKHISFSDNTTFFFPLAGSGQSFANNFLRPTGHIRASYEYALTRNFSLRAHGVAQYAGSKEIAEVEHAGELLRVVVPAYTLQLANLSAGLGATFKF
ncbi:MAG TPA: hypothetical protein DCE41_08605 [Cytophagales bacterium]|nr:hypothetical protein [Cytophagales bacterium]HAA21681.1 hypothetical protein [Cytophagales bacterium]HAP63740.1 hypothetical protein [Cytophagales bacterium]